MYKPYSEWCACNPGKPHSGTNSQKFFVFFFSGKPHSGTNSQK